MRRRQKTSPFEDAIKLASRLPWWLSLGIAGIVYLGLHWYAIQTEAAPKDIAALGGNAGRGLYRALAQMLQYLISAVFLIGAVVSVFQRRKLSKRFDQTQRLGTNRALLDMSWQDFEGMLESIFAAKAVA